MSKRYSYTRLNQFRTCPRQFKFNYIEKAAVEKPVGVEAFLGNQVHRALERLYKYKVNGRIQPLEEMLETYHAAWEGPDRDSIKVTRENMAVDDYIAIGVKALRRYYEIYQPFTQGEVLGLEKPINFPIDPDNRFTMTAKIDRLSQRGDGTVEIVDYKTNATIPTQQDLDNDLQMGLYQMGVRFLWPQFDRIELKQIYLRQGVEMTAVMNDDKIDMLSYDVRQRILEIEEAIRNDDFPVRESAICNWCVYYELCPAKRHRLALEDDISDAQFDASEGEKLAGEYLELDEKIKVLQSRQKALKEDIARFCEDFELSKLESDRGEVRVSLSDHGVSRPRPPMKRPLPSCRFWPAKPASMRSSASIPMFCTRNFTLPNASIRN